MRFICLFCVPFYHKYDSVPAFQAGTLSLLKG